MAYRIVSNKLNGEVTLLFTANDSVVVAGNNTVSNVTASASENIVSSHIRTVIYGAGSTGANTGYWKLSRGTNVVGVFAGSGNVSYSGSGVNLNLDGAANLVANLVGGTEGSLLVVLRKETAQNTAY